MVVLESSIFSKTVNPAYPRLAKKKTRMKNNRFGKRKNDLQPVGWSWTGVNVPPIDFRYSSSCFRSVSLEFVNMSKDMSWFEINTNNWHWEAVILLRLCFYDMIYLLSAILRWCYLFYRSHCSMYQRKWRWSCWDKMPEMS